MMTDHDPAAAPMTPAGFLAAVAKATPYHEAQRNYWTGHKRETREEYAARVARAAAEADCRRDLLATFTRAPGAVLDALDLGTLEERDAVVRLFGAVERAVYDISLRVTSGGSD